MKIFMEPKFVVYNNKATRCHLTTTVFLEYETLPITIKTKGLSKVHPDDEFNKVTGERLAEARAVHNMYVKLNSYLKRYIKFIEDKQTVYAMIINKNNRLIDKELSHIKELKNN